MNPPSGVLALWSGVYLGVTKTLTSAGHPHTRDGEKVKLAWVLVHLVGWRLSLWIPAGSYSPSSLPNFLPLRFQATPPDIKIHHRESSSSTYLYKVKSL